MRDSFNGWNKRVCNISNRNVATLQRGMACGQPAASTGEIVSLQQSIAVIVKHKLTTLIVVQR